MKLCVLGPTGRMGQQVMARAAAMAGVDVVAAVDHGASPELGESIEGVQITADLDAAMTAADVYIDFTTPQSTREAAVAAARHNTAAVIGTTGMDSGALEALATLESSAPVLVAPNFSLGVNLMLSLARTAAGALGDEYDLEIVELHHKHKRDAPSGTAIALARALADGQGDRLDDVKRYSREGDVGARATGEIGVFAVRGGGIVGEHTAYLIGENERIEITHRAHSRGIFADGALKAAQFIAGKPAGRYSMNDVLGL